MLIEVFKNNLESLNKFLMRGDIEVISISHEVTQRLLSATSGSVTEIIFIMKYMLK